MKDYKLTIEDGVITWVENADENGNPISGRLFIPKEVTAFDVDAWVFLGCEAEKIVVDPEKCPETARELQKYTLQKDKSGRFLGVWPDRDNHAIDALRYALEEVSSPGVGALYAGI